MAKARALGTKLFIEDPATPGQYLAVGNLTSVGVPGPEKPEIEHTDFDSTGAEFFPGLPDYGTLDFSGNYNEGNAGQAALFADAQNANAPVRLLRVEFTDLNVRFSFSAYVARFRPNAGGVTEAITFEGSLRVTGAVTKGTITP